MLISPPYRGRGLQRQLFEASRRTLAGQLGLGLAFIATDNEASWRVPMQALGLTVVVGAVVGEGRAYAILVFPAPR